MVTAGSAALDLVKYLAARDCGSFPRAAWEQSYRSLAQSHPADTPLPIP